MIRRLLVAITCLSCGAPWGQPHAPGCEFSITAHPRAGVPA